MAYDEEDRRLELHRVLPAPAERVWAAWTDAAEMGRWMCPGGVTESRSELDVREGGHLVIDMVDGENVYQHTGRYVTVDPPSHLSFTWVSSATADRETLVTVTLRPVEEGTELTLVHERLPHPEARDMHRSGWGSILEKLEQRLAIADRGGGGA